MSVKELTASLDLARAKHDFYAAEYDRLETHGTPHERARAKRAMRGCVNVAETWAQQLFRRRDGIETACTRQADEFPDLPSVRAVAVELGEPLPMWNAYTDDEADVLAELEDDDT